MSLIDEPILKDLHRVRKIRNAFAHEILVDSFENDAVRKLATDLSAPDRLMSDKVAVDVTIVSKHEPDKPVSFAIACQGRLLVPRVRFNVTCKIILTLLATR
jgi:hypothetical protein